MKISTLLVYPEGAVGNADIAPGDDDGVFDGFGGNVNTEEGAVAVICDLNVNGETLCVLKTQTHISLSPFKVILRGRQEAHDACDDER